MNLKLPQNAALILIDMQKAVDDPSWGKRNNLNAEKNAALLLTRWRKLSMPIYHIRHDSTDPNATYRPGQPGNLFKPEVQPIQGETIVAKRTNSAFIGTDLMERLNSAKQYTLIIVGVSTTNSVETTVRMAGNLGYNTYLVDDATFTFDKYDWKGRYYTAEELQNISLANLNKEYCTVIETLTVLNALK